MKKLSLKNVKVLSKGEMKSITGGYDPSLFRNFFGGGGGGGTSSNPIGGGIYDYIKGVVIEYVVNTVYTGAAQSANAHASGGTQVMIPGAVGTTTSIWVPNKSR